MAAAPRHLHLDDVPCVAARTSPPHCSGRWPAEVPKQMGTSKEDSRLRPSQSAAGNTIGLMLALAFGFGRIIHDGLMFRQNFSIRSYEIVADRTTSIETLMNHLQETAPNHVKTAGLLDDGFGSTPEMSKRNLLWVVSQMQAIVERYPCWLTFCSD
ncbi:hypothetical protein SETIT_9G277100v2 [Setaria italica]|uniref:Acyl-[acyl-carrier-protein] hydrolase n=1 Tax=Setaria italica TaxID=4555 RepID=K4AG69_SETIT|nr:palmitoyl-acyl carrier protein thioesterase, chloroplastic isoform X1 [Setaria italica]RCV43212.1 hypothetical protein SETIT_9G277100v2 [Setaria italica]RCV43213.1 hypothetical protein SETIT_9G277100v2 [Setaria italica]RCV43214.1 hypothetical protein SETIT_9G277100v2 [Setaria italica]